MDICMPLTAQQPIRSSFSQESETGKFLDSKMIQKEKGKKLTFDPYKWSTTSCRWTGQLLLNESARFSNPCSTFAQENLWSGKNINMDFLSNFQKKKDKILDFEKQKMNFQNQEVSNHLSKACQKKSELEKQLYTLQSFSTYHWFHY